MSGRRKLPDPLSAGDALFTSVMALPPDELGRVRWERAAALAGVSADHLKKCAAGMKPVRLQDVETIDRVNALAGGPATNRDAWRHRHDAALDGAAANGPEPMRYLERALADLAEAIRMVEFGKGTVLDLRRMSIALTKEGTQLMEVIAIRADHEATEEQRRRDRPEPPRLVGNGS